MNIRRIIREEISDFDWVNDFGDTYEISTDTSLNKKEVDGKGVLWVLDNWDDWVKFYNNSPLLNKRYKPLWAIRPGLLSSSEEIFNMYKKMYGNFNVFKSYNDDDVIGWFDGMGYAFNKRDVHVDTPI